MTLYLLSAGSNARGQLGHGHLEDSSTFQQCIFQPIGSTPVTQLPADSVISLCCGANHTLLLTEREDKGRSIRELWGCGERKKGQLGPLVSDDAQSHHISSSIFRQIGPEILNSLGFPPESVIQHVAASWESTYLALRVFSDHPRDALISFGGNDYGDLGISIPPDLLNFTRQPQEVDIETPLTNAYFGRFKGFTINKVVAGLHHVVVIVNVILTDGEDVTLVGWGASRHGQLGRMFESSNIKEKGKGSSSFTAIPRVLSIHPNPDPQSKIADVALGNAHTLILYKSGNVMALGSNRKRQLDGVTEVVQIKTIGCTWNGSYLVQKRHQNGQLLSTGAGGKGQLGHSKESISDVVFPFGTEKYSLISLACGSEHVLCLFERLPDADINNKNSELWGWGWNEHGTLGLGHTKDVYEPARLWKNDRNGQSLHDNGIIDIWSGCGTSWLLLQ